jgi:hypothetical protein
MVFLLVCRDYFGLVVIDEGHHASAQSYAAVMEYFAGAMQVGTAGGGQKKLERDPVSAWMLSPGLLRRLLLLLLRSVPWFVMHENTFSKNPSGGRADALHMGHHRCVLAPGNYITPQAVYHDSSPLPAAATADSHSLQGRQTGVAHG